MWETDDEELHVQTIQSRLLLINLTKKRTLKFFLILKPTFASTLSIFEGWNLVCSVEMYSVRRSHETLWAWCLDLHKNYRKLLILSAINKKLYSFKILPSRILMRNNIFFEEFFIGSIQHFCSVDSVYVRGYQVDIDSQIEFCQNIILIISFQRRRFVFDEPERVAT